MGRLKPLRADVSSSRFIAFGARRRGAGLRRGLRFERLSLSREPLDFVVYRRGSGGEEVAIPYGSRLAA